jgi:DNA-binding NtrC family response regulator
MAVILLVDDDRDVRDTLARMLRSADHEVIEAEGGLAALTTIEAAGTLDLLLTDIVMPGLNGFNLARMAIVKRPSLRVLYLTAFAETELVARDTGLRYGRMLKKPIAIDAFLAEITRALAAGGGSRR